MPELHACFDNALPAGIEEVNASQGQGLVDAAGLLKHNVGYLKDKERACVGERFPGALVPFGSLLLSRPNGKLYGLNASRPTEDRVQTVFRDVRRNIEQEECATLGFVGIHQMNKVLPHEDAVAAFGIGLGA